MKMKSSAIPKLMRLENCAMASIAAVVGFIVAGGNQVVSSLVLAIASVFLITGAGNAINDYYDREADKRNVKHRPIPSGAITPKTVLYISAALFAIGVVMSFFINEKCLALAGFNSVVLFFYGRNLKSTVFAGNVAVSYLTTSTFVYGALVVGDLTAVMFLALLAFLANVGREIIGDVEDISGDKKAKIKTYATKHGPKRSWLYGRLYILAAVLLSPVPYFINLFGQPYMYVVLLSDALFLVSIATKDARLNQRLTKIAIFVGLIAFLVGALI